MNIFDVFISYRRSDGLSIAEKLYSYLTSNGLRVFLDKSEMLDGHYFTTQITENLKNTPNYILIATDDVFKFRENEDWVQKEIEIAITEYEKTPSERTVTVLTPETVSFPQKSALSKNICNIADAQRIVFSNNDLNSPFYKALKAVTCINRRNLWFAAHRWLENSKQPGGRFATLNINESILPSADTSQKEHTEMLISVYKGGENQKHTQALLDAISSNNNHLYLIGQGGIGKTTALMHIMNSAYVDKAYSEKTQIPLFVELSFAPDTYGVLYENGKSSFIRRSIFKQLRTDRTLKQITAREVSDIDEVFTSLPYDVAVKPITDILSQTTPAPEYLLLLDGLNEVSAVTLPETDLSVVQMIMREIDLLISECPNVRIVLTSRSDESAISNDNLSRLYLSGIEEETIKAYLKSHGFSKDALNTIFKNKNLCETLKIPLFLTMYTSLSQHNEVTTQGEILKLFFNERRKNISIYTMQDRLSAVEKNVTNAASAVQKNRIDANMQNFILDFILPEIAWNMERKNEFYIRIRDIKKIIEPVLTSSDDLSVCGDFGKEIFSKYRNGASAGMHTLKIAKKIFERLGDDLTEVTEALINCSVFALGIMQESNGKYGFVHQHIRDYFAAIKNINTLRLSVYLYEEGENQLALECMNQTFKDEPINYTIRRFMGECLGEHKNKPYYAGNKWNYGVPEQGDDRLLIEKSLNIFVDVFNENIGYSLHSLIKILSESRKVLAGINLSRLNLKGCDLNACELGLLGLAADFSESLLTGENIFNMGHSEEITAIRFNESGSNILTAANDGCIKIWDVKTGRLIYTFEFEGYKILNASYINNEKQIAIACYKYDLENIPKEVMETLQIEMQDYIINLFILDLETEKITKKSEKIKLESSMLPSVSLSDNKRYIALVSSYILKVFSLDDFSVIFEHNAAAEGNSYSENIVSAEFICNDSHIAVTKANDSNITFASSYWYRSNRLEIHNLANSQEANQIIPTSDDFRMIKENNNLVIIEKNKNFATFKTINPFLVQLENEFKLFYSNNFNSMTIDFGSYAKYSKDKKYIIILSGGTAYLFDTKNYSLLHCFWGECFESADFNNSNTLITLGTKSGKVLLYDLNTFTPIMQIKTPNPEISRYEISSDNKYIVTFSEDNKLRLWDAETHVLLNQKSYRWLSLTSCAAMRFCPERNMLSLYPINGKTYFIDLPSLEPLSQLSGDCIFSHDSAYIVSQQEDDNLNAVLYNADDLTQICSLENASYITFKDNLLLALSDAEKTKTKFGTKTHFKSLTIINTKDMKILQKLTIENDVIINATISKDYIAAISKSEKLYIWDSKSFALIKQFKTKASSLKFSNDENYLFETTLGDVKVIRKAPSFETVFETPQYSCCQCTDKYIFLTEQVSFSSQKVLVYTLETIKKIYSFNSATFAASMFFSSIKTNADNKELLVKENNSLLGIYRIYNNQDEDFKIEKVDEIKIAYGIDLIGVDFTNLHPESDFTEEEKAGLKKYGAKI